MKIERLSIRDFQCFGPNRKEIAFEENVTTFVGGNGSGKTAAFLALSRLFGVTSSQRTIRRRDFHIPKGSQELESGASLAIEVVFGFPELEGLDEEDYEDAVPEFFLQMAASAPGEPLKVRMQLRATWTDDSTPDGDIEEDLRWIKTLEETFNWDECTRVQSVHRGSVQLVYVPASRDAASQVTNLLKGRLWQAARWSEGFRNRSAQGAERIQQLFEREEPAEFVIERLSARWSQLNEADTETTPALRLVDSRFEELVRKAEFVFSPDEEGRERELADLSDGQRSLFHIALTAATLEVEKDAFAQPAAGSAFEHEKLRRTHLTLLAIEEPENSLSPFFLSRIVSQAREIGALPTAQVMLSSHSPAILSRIEPEEVRYFRLNRNTRRSYVRKLTLPTGDQEARQYVRLAVKAYPELYFAKFVVLGEGDSERLVIPRIATAMGIPLDPSFVPVVPLAGRFAGHFWKLLSDLRIPHATLLDLDLGRRHGGANTIEKAVNDLQESGMDLSENSYVEGGTVDLEALDELTNEELLDEDHDWFDALAEQNVFFSHPLDLDFAMLFAFSDEYQISHPGGQGPRMGADAVAEKKSTALKTGGDPDLYGDEYNEAFGWYPYLFLNRSKPETHIVALSRIEKESLAEKAPKELKALIDTIRESLGLPEVDE
ncbi:ATP-dependent nuclease [Mesorhizobium sp. PL10]